jgi:hypothetical protein
VLDKSLVWKKCGIRYWGYRLLDIEISQVEESCDEGVMYICSWV